MPEVDLPCTTSGADSAHGALVLSAHGAPVLSAQDLGAQRGERPLFRKLGLCLQPGQLLWLRGRNGRGKTTLLRILAGLSTPARGQVRLAGHEVHRLPPALRPRLLYLAHANGLKDDLTVTEALRFLAQLQGARPDPAALAAALALVGMDARATALVRTLSQGQRRRAALARLVLAQAQQDTPGVWLLDEPFDALDDEGVQMLNQLLARHARAGGSVLLTSHQAVSLGVTPVLTLDLDPYAFVPASGKAAAPAAGASALPASEA